MTQFNEMQTVKRRFFAMRNGAVADNMRRHGANYRIIFGLNLPQIVEIANETPSNATLAEALWKNQSTRESMLMAPMIYPRDEFGFETACRWVSEVSTAEVGDVLCHRLLRYKDFAWQLAIAMVVSSKAMERYVALRLMFNLLPSHLDEVKDLATIELEKNEQLTSMLCRQLIDEVDFLKE
ncbi:MAG: DNA alkylation repair protein [Muribaculaceae bacterium]|nr:DNA alkylation repair protein [Muribaculaceae bacterium]